MLTKTRNAQHTLTRASKKRARKLFKYCIQILYVKFIVELNMRSTEEKWLLCAFESIVVACTQL